MSSCPIIFPAQIDPFVSGGLQGALGDSWLTTLTSAVQSALNENIQELIDWNIRDGTDFALFASGMLEWVPTENYGGKVIYDVLVVFYFVFDQSGINTYQTVIDTTSINEDGSVKMTALSQWMVDFAQKMGTFMGTAASVTTDSYNSFVNSPLFHLEEAKVPAGGFQSFNDLFARSLIKGMRPISCPTDDRVIVYPADSTFDGAWTISSGTVPINTYEIQTASIKGIDWPISDLLGGSQYAQNFNDGIWMHAFLGPTDYHRQHAPVSGTVLEAKNIMGLAYLNVRAETTADGKKYLRSHRNFKDEPDAPDDAGYQFLQLRASIIIQNDLVGKVAVLPIGMAQVSSVVLNPAIVPSQTNPTPTVNKGDEISHFEFGGSDIVLVFGATAKVLILGATETLPSGELKGQKYLVGQPLGIAGLG